MILIKNTTTFIILFSILISLSCSTDNPTASNSNIHLYKPNNINDIHNTETSDFEKWIKAFRGIAGIPSSAFAFTAALNPALFEYICFFAYLIGLEEIFINNEESSSIIEAETDLYNFRDYYLNKTTKGQSYIASYYALSKFGIDNNLINRYHKEHTYLLIKSIEAAKTLQYGISDDKIINNDIADKIEFLVKVYRDHPNHRDIDPVLDYLEKDLEKYQNQPKSVISADFK